MSDKDKITESSNDVKSLIWGLVFDIIKLILFGALAIDLMFD